MDNVFTDPATGRQYTVDPVTGRSVWIDQTQPHVAPMPGAPTGPPQPWTPPQGGAKKGHPVRNVLLVGIGVLVIIVIIGAVLSGGASTSGDTDTAGSNASASDGSAAVADSTAGIGTPVRDGKFEFTVTKVTPGVTTIGDEYLNTKAQGQFVLVTIQVENIGDEAQMFDGGNQYLYDTQGRQFSSSTEAAFYLDDQGESFLNDINPGNTVTGVVVFDVPEGTELAKIELHDSLFSGGVDVSLT